MVLHWSHYFIIVETQTRPVHRAQNDDPNQPDFFRPSVQPARTR
jgi:hypothetical protein